MNVHHGASITNRGIRHLAWISSYRIAMKNNNHEFPWLYRLGSGRDSVLVVWQCSRLHRGYFWTKITACAICSLSFSPFFLARDALPFTVIIVYICIRATVRINKLKVCINIVIIINGSSCGKLIKHFFMKRSVAIPWFKHNSPPGLAPMLFSPF